MGDAEVVTSIWRNVELGRVILITQGPYAGKLAAIVEIIDHKRILVDNPTFLPSDSSKTTTTTVPRHSLPLAHSTLTHLVVPKIPRAIGAGPLRKQWEAAEVEKKWGESAWAKTRERGEKRRQLSDFERFKVMRLRKQARSEIRKSVAKVRVSAKA